MWRRLSLKWKFIFAVLTLATFSGIIAYFYFPHLLGLVLLFFYIIPSNSFIPFPHEPAIIYYGKIYGPYLTTLAAIIPTAIACIIDYAVLTPVFNRTRLSRIKQTGIYQKTVYYFEKAPFLTNLVAALSPVPFYPVRILSVASGYPMWKYTTAVVTGRIPRYFFLAVTGALLNIPNWFIGLFFLSLVSAPLYKKLSGWWRKRQAGTAPSVVEELVIQESEDGEELEEEIVPTAATNR
jgi:uncharacterized membrane protein YdjX (TVP38/TMEM64 family)